MIVLLTKNYGLQWIGEREENVAWRDFSSREVIRLGRFRAVAISSYQMVYSDTRKCGRSAGVKEGQCS